MSTSGQRQTTANVRCSCMGYNLDKLLQPNILILLAEKELHGYSVIQELEQKNLFPGEKVDNAGVYRTLKTLENRGMVEADWELGEENTPRKVYRITDTGLDCLRNWIETLEQYRVTVDTVIADGKRVLAGR